MTKGYLPDAKDVSVGALVVAADGSYWRWDGCMWSRLPTPKPATVEPPVWKGWGAVVEKCEPPGQIRLARALEAFIERRKAKRGEAVPAYLECYGKGWRAKGDDGKGMMGTFSSTPEGAIRRGWEVRRLAESRAAKAQKPKDGSALARAFQQPVSFTARMGGR